MFEAFLRVHQRSIAAFLAFMTVCTLVFTELGGAVAVQASSKNLLDGTKYSTPVKGTSYYFDFIGNRELSSAKAGEYGLLTVSDNVRTNGHGQQHSTGTSLTIKLPGSSKVSIGYCAYDTPGTGFVVSSDTGSIGSLPTFPEKQTYKCYESSGQLYSFEYTEEMEGEQSVTITFNSTYYIPYIEVETLDREETEQVKPEGNSIYTYDFSSQATSITVPTSYDSKNPIKTLVSKDGFLTINGNGTMYHHGTQHGLVVKQGNSFEVTVAGNAFITFELCEYSKQGTIDVSYSTKKGQISKESIRLKGTKDGQKADFIYKGNATTLTFTINGDGYLHGINVQNTTDDVDATQWKKKDFSFKIAGTTVTVEGAKNAAEDAAITLSKGQVYYADSESAYLQLPLDGNALNTRKIDNLSEEVVDSFSISADGSLVVTMKDQTTYPYTYTIKIQDSKKFETPEPRGQYEYNFLTGTVPFSFTSTNRITSTYTTDDGMMTIGKGSGSAAPYWHSASHGILLNNKNYIEVDVAGDAEVTFSLCEYGAEASLEAGTLKEGANGSFSKQSFKGSSCKDTITYTYAGEAATLRFTLTSSGTNYLHKVTVKNQAVIIESDVVDIPLATPEITGNTDLFTVYAHGQKLKASHYASGSSVTTGKDLGYYLFAPTTEAQTMEADIKVQSIIGSSANGVFFGLFEDAKNISKIATIGLRGDGKIRNVYHKTGNSTASAGGLDVPYSVGDIIHVSIKKDAKAITSSVTVNNKTVTSTVKYTAMELLESSNSNARCGMAFSNADAIIMNLTYTAADGTVLYDQNACYAPVGTAPQAEEVYTPVVSEDRTSITVEWAGDSCKDDASYQAELSLDGGATFTTISKYITQKMVTVPIEQDGAYQFRITGVLGNTYSNAVTSEVVEVVKPLDKPVVTAESADQSIRLTWEPSQMASMYEVYRRSSEEDAFTMVASVTEAGYEDCNVTNETPYYYYVIAKNESNESNPSETVMTVPSAGHEGDYVQEEEAAKLVITSKSNDTVFENYAIFSGTTDREGTMAVSVNGTVQSECILNAEDAFTMQAMLEQGRNDVTLLFTDASGKVTRKTYNFVYLTNYDFVVDASYEGEDGDVSKEYETVKIFKSVQAAVNAVPANNASRVVIFIKNGSYREHLVVTKPNVTLIGEDRELVNINYYDPVESPAGGDTAKRCAVYVTSQAANFAAENLTVENTYEYLGDGSISNESADALRVDAPNSVFINVKMLGYQDTLDAGSNYQYYYKCYIAGNVDYIYGSAQALFEDCDLVYRYSEAKNAGYITAPKTSEEASYGYIFNNCRIYAEEGCTGSKYLLARPWGPDGAAAFINCYMGAIVNAASPYADMSGNLAVNARFKEYYSYGPGFAINKNRPQISSNQAETMLTAEALGWDARGTAANIGTQDYVGTILPVPEEPELPEETPFPTETPVEPEIPEVPETPAPTVTPEATPVQVNAVRNVKVTSVTAKRAVVSWSKDSSVNGYTVTYKNAAGKTVTRQLDASKTSVTMDGLAPDARYQLSIKAYRMVNGTKYESEETKITVKTAKLAAPSSVKAKSATMKDITLSWTKVTEADGYVISYKNALGKTVKTTVSGKTTSYKASKLLAGKTYQFTVQSFAKVNGKVVYGGKVSKKVKTASITKPAKTYITSLSSPAKRSLRVKVKAKKSAEGYEAAYSLKKDSGFKTVDLKSSTSKDIKKLKSNKTYYVKVRSYKTVYQVEKGKLVTKKVYSNYSAVKKVKVK